MTKAFPLLVLAGSLSIPAFSSDACQQLHQWPQDPCAIPFMDQWCDEQFDACLAPFQWQYDACASAAESEKSTCLDQCNGQACDACWSNYWNELGACQDDLGWNTDVCHSEWDYCCALYCES
jgi:hypothetical protein